MRMSGSVVNNLELRFDGAKRDDRWAEHSFAIPDQGTMALQSLAAPRAAPVRKRGTTHRPQGIPAPSPSRLGKVAARQGRGSTGRGSRRESQREGRGQGVRGQSFRVTEVESHEDDWES